MTMLKIGRHAVEVYDDIETLPIVRFHKYNKMLLVDAGIGSDMADFDRHIERAMRYATSKTPDQTVKELNNLRQSVYMIQTELSPRHLAFAALVKAIDGKPRDDISDDGLRETAAMLNDAPIKDMTTSIEAVKKKIDDALQQYFPKVFDDTSIKEYYDILRRRTLLILEAIIKGAEPSKEVDKLTTELLLYSKPQVFDGEESLEVEHDKRFDRMCMTISQHLHVDPKRYTVLEYYNAFEYIKEMSKEAQKKAADRKKGSRR
jgi:hypothetical protein